MCVIGSCTQIALCPNLVKGCAPGPMVSSEIVSSVLGSAARSGELANIASRTSSKKHCLRIDVFNVARPPCLGASGTPKPGFNQNLDRKHSGSLAFLFTLEIAHASRAQDTSKFVSPHRQNRVSGCARTRFSPAG